MTTLKSIGFILSLFLICGCTKPIGNSLLTSLNSSSCTDFACDDGSSIADASAVLAIASDKTSIPSFLDANDTVEITGTCNDLNRKDNRIYVQVFAGQDVGVNPYIDNSISDECQTTQNPITSGVEPTDLRMVSYVAMGFGQAYAFAATGGVPPYTYSIAVPIAGGGSINSGTGVYTSAATNGFEVIKVLDSSPTPISFFANVQIQNGVAAPTPTSATNKCFWNTGGIGLIEPVELPQVGPPKIFPQCHNGRYSFSVKLGRAQKYTARVKLRAVGTSNPGNAPVETPWSDNITIDRTFPMPTIASVSDDGTSSRFTIKSNASRFNLGILYTLTRTYTDITTTAGGLLNIFSNATSANLIGPSIIGSVAEYYDVTNLVPGVTYNYTLTATDINNAAIPNPQTVNSAVTSVMMPKPTAVYAGITSGTCYFSMSTVNVGVSYQWAYSTVNGWPGANYDNNSFVPPLTISTCTDSFCNQSGLVAGNTYYFAVRAYGGGQIGKWSNTASCRPN